MYLIVKPFGEMKELIEAIRVLLLRLNYFIVDCREVLLSE
jgi:hypothetical protein